MIGIITEAEKESYYRIKSHLSSHEHHKNRTPLLISREQNPIINITTRYLKAESRS
jgi:hypothetical protein